MPVKAANRIGRRCPLNLRTTEEIRRKLEDAASRNGRSLTQEVEFRIERSFQSIDREALLADIRAVVAAGMAAGALSKEYRSPRAVPPAPRNWLARR